MVNKKCLNVRPATPRMIKTTPTMITSLMVVLYLCAMRFPRRTYICGGAAFQDAGNGMTAFALIVPTHCYVG